jgi:hypothetical protein
MTTTSRKSAREHLAGQLTGALVGTGKPAQAVYAYRVGDFQGQSPVVVVSSGGTLRERFTFKNTRPVYTFTIHVFVLYADEAGTWTEQDAEDALDDIEEIIASTIQANQKSPYWETISFDAPSQTAGVMVGGKEYRTEVITVRMA